MVFTTCIGLVFPGMSTVRLCGNVRLPFH
jgi:hypothetical protein